MLPFLLPALKIAAPLVGGALAGRGSKGSAAPSATQNRYDTALAGAGERSASLQAEGDRRMLDFDPQEMMRSQITGFAGEEQRRMDRSLDALAGRAAGAGRLNTGFFDLDQGSIVRDSNERLQDVIAQTAGQATAMTQRNNESIGMRGQQAGDQYLDLITGQLDREQGERNARQQERTGRLSAGASLVGSFLGTETGGNVMRGVKDYFGRKTPSMVDAGPTQMTPISTRRR